MNDIIPVNTLDELLGLIRLYGHYREQLNHYQAYEIMASIKAALAGWKP